MMSERIGLGENVWLYENWEGGVEVSCWIVLAR